MGEYRNGKWYEDAAQRASGDYHYEADKSVSRTKYEKAQTKIDTLTKALKKVSDYNLRLEQGLIPEGYVIVPVEPTENVINAFWKVVEEDKEARISNVYKAMIQAAREEIV